jgi:hypothetical protein
MSRRCQESGAQASAVSCRILRAESSYAPEKSKVEMKRIGGETGERAVKKI